MEYKQWYMEYKIHKNRPGLLGDIASLARNARSKYFNN